MKIESRSNATFFWSKKIFITKKNSVRNLRFRSVSHTVFVPRAGIEPALPKEQDFESSASTSSATEAFFSTFRDAKIQTK